METDQLTEPTPQADETAQPNAPMPPAPEVTPTPPTSETDVPPWMQCPNGGCCDG
ncbi:MAG: hypothetical protein ACP5R2_11715 [Anaerolineae bacterium]